jgi:hypothetical protein
LLSSCFTTSAIGQTASFLTVSLSEPAVVKVLSDILLAPDTGHQTVLTLRDLSATFEPDVDHAALLRRLKSTSGLGGGQSSVGIDHISAIGSSTPFAARRLIYDPVVVLSGAPRDLTLNRSCSLFIRWT